MTFEFSTRDYLMTYGHAPRGYGMWAFTFEKCEPIWAPASTYANAKKWVKTHIKNLAPTDYTGHIQIKVCT